MKRFIFLCLVLHANLIQSTPTDQFLIVFGASGYVLYKTLDFANDHGFRYIKILSYEFNGFGHKISGTCEGGRNQGRYFEWKDEMSNISFLCFDKKPTDDPYVFDLEKYRFLLTSEENTD